MKFSIKHLLVALALSAPAGLYAQSPAKEVSDATMQQVYEAVKTPYKYGLVVVPDNEEKKIDCPSVFRHGRKWYMTYVIFNGRGYETWLSKSNDLLHWKQLGRVMSFSDTADWDNNQKAGYIALQEPELDGKYRLQKHDGKYWMSYFGGVTRGYEAGDLSIGMAYTKKNPSKPHEWTRLSKPILTSQDKDVRWWENRKQYKNSVIWDKSQTTGHPFVMYYNANGDTTGNVKLRWFERIGMAVSDDMVHWKRFEQQPVMAHEKGITGDAVILKKDDVWVMFYFGAFWKNSTESFNRFACSYDLVHWTDWKGEDLVKPSEAYDEKYAHKSFVVKYKGVVYHYYCAVNKKDQRGIAVTTSKDMGKSTVRFVTPSATATTQK